MTSLLDPVRHERLIRDINHIREVANIPLEYLETSMHPLCGVEEVEWVKAFHKNRATQAGLLLVGLSEGERHALSICGALVRNFVDARVVPLNTLLNAAESDSLPEPTVMVVPNFYQNLFGKALPAWKVSTLYDVLLSRFTAGKPTVLVIDSFESMSGNYGQSLVDHLKSHYKVVQK